ncbi:sigma-54 interaction domain-containing protein [Lentibacillus sp. Marseille-P4043]|uniref:sigma-54 interaction domain-containing protein n=1 Tax=Lentibacillus sp. Marseille-P4043 TaxID=2040293 RepID=UPI000D0BE065|nr:sigma 54-interacting transcriptional regulator [Lentibacillus sp. Marseille-P4043]
MLSLDAIEVIPFPVIVVDAGDGIVAYNEKMGAYLKHTIEKGCNISTLFTRWDRNFDSKLITAMYAGKSFIFMEENFDSNSGSRLLIGMETQELDSLQSENNTLKNLNRELDAIIENSYDGIYITDHNGVTWKTNSAIERITGIPKEYYIGKNVSALIKRGILNKSVTEKVLKHRRTVSVVQKNYTGKETLLTGTPVFNEEGDIEKIVTNIRDLSDLNELQTELRKVNQLKDKYKEEIIRLKNSAQQLDGIITKSSAMEKIYETAKRIANIDATVLILGETGVGKDVLANYIYSNSTRAKEGEFVKVNCGAIPPDLLESELFGYESGAFTGANQKGKPGMFEMADKGILFLDEIAELPLTLQVKLLRVLQEGEIQRIGSTKPKKIDVRIIAATNRHLQEMVYSGDFREDLFYRLHVIPFVIPPLSERRDDIIPLIQLFLNRFNEKYNMKKRFDHDLKDFLYAYDWPGNIRELSNLMERLVVTAPNEIISMENLPPDYYDTNNTIINSIIPLKKAVETAEEKVLMLAVEKYNNTYEIADALETSQPTVVRKLKKYKLDTKLRTTKQKGF